METFRPWPATVIRSYYEHPPDRGQGIRALRAGAWRNELIDLSPSVVHLCALSLDATCTVVQERTRLRRHLLQHFRTPATEVLLRDLVHHHLQELLVLDPSVTIVMHIRDYVLDFLLLWFETQRAHRRLHFLGVDGATAVGVKEVERLFDLLHTILAHGIRA